MLKRSPVLFFSITACLFAAAMFIRNGVWFASPLSDGGSHYVTGLLAYDWIHLGRVTNPIAFGTEYFKHFPYIGLLLWPPLFYGLEMVAFSIFGPSVHVGMILVSVIFVGTAVILANYARENARAALVIHCLIAAMLTSVLVQDVQRNLLIDGLVSGLSLAATLQFARYVRNPSWGGAIASGVWAILAFYAKGNALQLGLAFPIVAFVLGRPAMLLDRRTIAMALGCILITGPWLYVTAGLSAQGFLYAPGIAALLTLTSQNLKTLFLAMPVLAPFAVIGATVILCRALRVGKFSREVSVFEAGCLAITVACISFHAILAVATDPRYMLSALFGAFGLALVGAEAAVAFVSSRLERAPSLRAQALCVALMVCAQVLMGLLTPLEAVPGGANAIATAVFKILPEANRSLLISGDHNIETSVGPALAQLEGNRRRDKDGVIVVRGSRAFASGGYRNRDYEAKFKNDAEYAEELRRLGIAVIVTAPPRVPETWGHLTALPRILTSATSDYEKVATIPFFEAQEATVWQLKKTSLKPIDFEVVTASNTLRERLAKVVK